MAWFMCGAAHRLVRGPVTGGRIARSGDDHCPAILRGIALGRSDIDPTGTPTPFSTVASLEPMARDWRPRAEGTKCPVCTAWTSPEALPKDGALGSPPFG